MPQKKNTAIDKTQKLTDQEQQFLGLVKSSLMKNYLDKGANLSQENLLAIFSLAKIALREETTPPCDFTLENLTLPENRGLTLTQLRSKHPGPPRQHQPTTFPSKQYHHE